MTKKHNSLNSGVATRNQFNGFTSEKTYWKAFDVVTILNYCDDISLKNLRYPVIHRGCINLQLLPLKNYTGDAEHLCAQWDEGEKEATLNGLTFIREKSGVVYIYCNGRIVDRISDDRFEENSYEDVIASWLMSQDLEWLLRELGGYLWKAVTPPSKVKTIELWIDEESNTPLCQINRTKPDEDGFMFEPF